MRPQYVKIPERLYGRVYRRFGRKGIHDILFWYKLKSYKIDGYFDRDEIKDLFRGVPNRTILDRLYRLSQLGLIKVDDTGIRLSKYDKLFELVGHDMSKHFDNNGSFVRRGKFKIWKLRVDLADEQLLDYIMYFDIKLTVIRKNLYLRMRTHEEIKRGKKADGRIKRRHIDADIFAGKAIDYRRSAISGKYVANIFGLKTASGGHKILIRLRNEGFLRVSERYGIRDLNPISARGKYKRLISGGKAGKYRLKNGILMEVLSNGIQTMD